MSRFFAIIICDATIAKSRHKSVNLFPILWHHWFQCLFLHILPKVWIRLPHDLLSYSTHRNRINSNSSFQENSFWSWALFWKLDFKISQLQSIIQKRISGRSGPNFWYKIQHGAENEEKIFLTYAWVLAKASRIIPGDKFSKVRSSVLHDKWQVLAIFGKTITPFSNQKIMGSAI